MKVPKSRNSEPGKVDAVQNAPAKDVEEYLASVPEAMQTALGNLRRAIKAAAPSAEEVISYRIPTYKYHGPLVHFVARTKHISFIVVNRSILETFKTELEAFKTSGTTIHFSPDNPLPPSLVEKIVKARMKQNEALHK